VIVISGALLVVAVVFLVIGLWVSVAWVYPSIGAGLIAFILMLIVIRQQKNLADEPVPPLHPVGGSGDVPRVPEAAVTSEGSASSEPPTAPTATAADPVPAAADEDTGPGEPVADVPLVPATRKSAVKKTSAAKTTAPGKVAAAKKTAAKRATAKRTAADGTTEAPAAKKATRKAAPRKPAEQPEQPEQAAQPDQLELEEPAAESPPSEG
jgi:hypothetical protein